MSVTQKALSIVQTINQRGWSGDVGIGAIAALVVGFPTWLWGPGGSLWGVPISMVWGAVAAVGGFFCSLGMYSMPKAND